MDRCISLLESVRKIVRGPMSPACCAKHTDRRVQAYRAAAPAGNPVCAFTNGRIGILKILAEAG
jgi:hypothetical protein